MKKKTITAAPKRTSETVYHRALAEICPPETWKEIVTKTVEQALAGDDKARYFLAAFLIGQPKETRCFLLDWMKQTSATLIYWRCSENKEPTT